MSGWVKDSATLNNLAQATISFYRQKDSSVVKYQFNDSRGRFNIGGLPLDTGLILTVSYIGFKPYKKQFRLSASQAMIDFGKILMTESNQLLDEVIIKPPPMVMRGDTLEFNADAFSTEKNAVVGDLLKRLPGVIIWGDGKITVNGKKVSQVMVEGKIFFSGDARIATDNLPKGVVDKIQVIKDKSTEERDSAQTVTLNIALKKGKKSGVFGKVGGGVGTDKKYQGDLMLAGFSPKSQLSVAGNLNNINKAALSVQEMMVNSSYRSGATFSTFNEPGFRQQGLTEMKSGGLIYNTDWNKRLKSRAEIIAGNNNFKNNELYDVSTLLTDSVLLRQSAKTTRNSGYSNRETGNVTYADSIFNQIDINVDVRYNNDLYKSFENATISSSSAGLLSKNFSDNNQRVVSNNFNAGISYAHRGDTRKTSHSSKEDFYIDYNYDRNRSNSDGWYKNEFQPFNNADTATYFNRKTQRDTKTSAHKLYAEFTSLNALLKLRTRTKFFVQNQLYYQQKQEDVAVSDFDMQTNSYSLKIII
ncbi:hypothetical protein GCM10023149_31210 [Mucilaginibacter gynuensis]|uniref:TonB-dependent receptor n=1 Tax=Mucilaginibacter gynuensis TaxID=1302236 RepID=A0ABP8GNU2_9SPHI